MKVPAERLRSLLGVTDVNYVQGNALAGDRGFIAGVTIASDDGRVANDDRNGLSIGFPLRRVLGILS